MIFITHVWKSFAMSEFLYIQIFTDCHYSLLLQEFYQNNKITKSFINVNSKKHGILSMHNMFSRLVWPLFLFQWPLGWGGPCHPRCSPWSQWKPRPPTSWTNWCHLAKTGQVSLSELDSLQSFVHVSLVTLHHNPLVSSETLLLSTDPAMIHLGEFWHETFYT